MRSGILTKSAALYRARCASRVRAVQATFRNSLLRDRAFARVHEVRRKYRLQEETMRVSKSKVILSNLCLILVSVSRVAFGQASGNAAQPPAAADSAPTTGVRAEVTRLIDDAETKLTKLAQAIPAEKYSWRPSKDARSVSEVFLHVAGGDFEISARLGSGPPCGLYAQ